MSVPFRHDDDLPVVLVPGMLCDGGLWDGMRGSLDGTVVDAVIDAPSITEMAEQVLGSVEGRFRMVGLSLGAIAGFEALRLAPERIAAFCAVSTNSAAPRSEQFAAWRKQDRLVRAGRFEAVLREAILPGMFAERSPAPERADRFLTMARRVGPAVFRAQLAAQSTRVDALASLGAVACPTLVVCGDRDALCPPEFHRRIAHAVPGARLSVLPEAGHLLPLEQPDELASLLRDHLAGADRSRTASPPRSRARTT
ncbi:alpha/beta fold hydrolase [Streptomyces sp. NPDC002490]|uniref:alpha/beta fold hydrolase n=1 Tax=Streptomyces sp. NPDC002490 TaxID=3154416 RepID=UPI0033194805